MNDWKNWAAQIGGGAYLAVTTWVDGIDLAIKAIIGLSMSVLAWHQIRALRRRAIHIDNLERFHAVSKVRCLQAAEGGCWMQEEIDTERERSKP